jgi:hypothetical protein
MIRAKAKLRSNVSAACKSNCPVPSKRVLFLYLLLEMPSRSIFSGSAWKQVLIVGCLSLSLECYPERVNKI